MAQEAREALIGRLITDVTEIVKVTGMTPKRLVLMTAPAWKQDLLADALAQTGAKVDISALIRSAMAKVSGPEAKKEVPAFAKEVATDVSRLTAENRKAASVRTDELQTLRRSAGFLQGQFGCAVEVYAADDPARYDPKAKARFAKPGRPAVYIE
jgi:leucyl-tRNA synthetase